MTCSSPLTMTYHRPNGQSTPEKLPIFRRKNCLRTPTHGRVVTWVGERVWQLWNSNYRWFSSWESDDYLTWGFKMLILTSAWSCDILQPTNMVFQMRLTTKNPPCGEVKKQLYIYVCVPYHPFWSLLCSSQGFDPKVAVLPSPTKTHSSPGTRHDWRRADRGVGARERQTRCEDGDRLIEDSNG